MREEDLFEALGDVDPEMVKEADEYSGKHDRKKGGNRKLIAAAAVCAAAAAVVISVFALRGTGLSGLFGQTAGPNDISGTGRPADLMAVVAEYPEPVAPEMSAQEFVESDLHWEWWDAYREKMMASQDLQGGISDYYMSVMEQLLVSEDENTVCSPLNIYIAFSMLAEVTEGETRQQILDMLGVSDIETLRENVSVLWNANYVDTPTLTSLLADSLWLRNDMEYDAETLQLLADQYYASSFSGVPGSEEMDQSLRTWTDENTGGLLGEYTADMSLDPETVLAIVSTVYYRATWSDEFSEDDTSPGIFHGTAGDTEVDMMRRTATMGVYRADEFTSLGLALNDSGSMYFLLPDEGVDVNELTADPQILDALTWGGDEENWSYPLVHLSVPRFRVSSRTDLLSSMRALGVTDALDPALADFSPLTADSDGIYVSGAEHAALVEIDEYGVTGAAYTMMMNAGAAMPEDEIDFTLDRPFMFVVTGRDGSILFAGVVRNI